MYGNRNFIFFLLLLNEALPLSSLYFLDARFFYFIFFRALLFSMQAFGSFYQTPSFFVVSATKKKGKKKGEIDKHIHHSQTFSFSAFTSLPFVLSVLAEIFLLQVFFVVIVNGWHLFPLQYFLHTHIPTLHISLFNRHHTREIEIRKKIDTPILLFKKISPLFIH